MTMVIASVGCACEGPVGAMVLNKAPRARPGVWYQGGSVGDAIAPGCDFPGGIAAREGEAEAAFNKRAAACYKSTEAMYDAAEESDAAWTDFWNRQANRAVDDMIGAIFGDSPRTPPRPAAGLSTGAKVGIGVGVATVVVTVFALVFKGKK